MKTILLFRSRYLDFVLCLIVFVIVSACGCKSKIINPVFVGAGSTNIQVNIRPTTSFVLCSNYPAISGKDSISIMITNLPAAAPEKHISLAVTGSSILQVTNVVNISTVLFPSNSGTGMSISGTAPPTVMAQHQCSIICRILDIIDHHLKDILSFWLSWIGLKAGRKISQPHEGETEADKRRRIIGLAGILFVLVTLVLLLEGVWTFSSNRSPEALAGRLASGASSINITTVTPPNSAANFMEKAAIPVVSLIGALIAAYLTYLYPKKVEKRSVNNAILSEIRRLYYAVYRHRKWRKDCLEDLTTHNIIYPLILFTHPVYDRHVDKIGVLNENIVAPAVALYDWIDFINDFQEIRDKYVVAQQRDLWSTSGQLYSSYKPVDRLFEFNERYDGILDRFLHEFKNTFNSALREANIEGLGSLEDIKPSDSSLYK